MMVSAANLQSVSGRNREGRRWCTPQLGGIQEAFWPSVKQSTPQAICPSNEFSRRTVPIGNALIEPGLRGCKRIGIGKRRCRTQPSPTHHLAPKPFPAALGKTKIREQRIERQGIGSRNLFPVFLYQGLAGRSGIHPRQPQTAHDFSRNQVRGEAAPKPIARSFRPMQRTPETTHPGPREHESVPLARFSQAISRQMRSNL